MLWSFLNTFPGALTACWTGHLLANASNVHTPTPPLLIPLWECLPDREQAFEINDYKVWRMTMLLLYISILGPALFRFTCINNQFQMKHLSSAEATKGVSNIGWFRTRIIRVFHLRNFCKRAKGINLLYFLQNLSINKGKWSAYLARVSVCECFCLRQFPHEGRIRRWKYSQAHIPSNQRSG